MAEKVVIKGGRATEFEAAVIGAVVDRITEEEQAAREGAKRPRPLSAWVRALRSEETGVAPEPPSPHRV